MSDASPIPPLPPIASLSRTQRRVLGTLVEKAITVPESYPLTLKALTTGCNQKNNRHPLTTLEEADVEETINELRKLGLAAVVHTESGRTERYRHYMRQRFASLSEPQLAILTELLLRGRQAAGDLRARASRMCPAGTLDSLDELRPALAGLMEMKLVQSNGPLERRGVEIDHNLYEPREGQALTQRTTWDDEVPSANPTPAAPIAGPTLRTAAPAVSSGGDTSLRIQALETASAGLKQENRDLKNDLESLRTDFARLAEAFEELRRALGG